MWAREIRQTSAPARRERESRSKYLRLFRDTSMTVDSCDSNSTPPADIALRLTTLLFSWFAALHGGITKWAPVRARARHKRTRCLPRPRFVSRGKTRDACLRTLRLLESDGPRGVIRALSARSRALGRDAQREFVGLTHIGTLGAVSVSPAGGGGRPRGSRSASRVCVRRPPARERLRRRRHQRPRATRRARRQRDPRALRSATPTRTSSTISSPAVPRAHSGASESVEDSRDAAAREAKTRDDVSSPATDASSPALAHDRDRGPPARCSPRGGETTNASASDRPRSRSGTVDLEPNLDLRAQPGSALPVR